MEDNVKMFLFGRWIATCYEGVLNKEDCYWWAKQLKHFNEVVYPNYVENGSAESTAKFLEKLL